MSYYSTCAEYAFTQTQKNLINTDFLSGNRAYIRTGVIPSQLPVEAPVQYMLTYWRYRNKRNAQISCWTGRIPQVPINILSSMTVFVHFTFNPIRQL